MNLDLKEMNAADMCDILHFFFEEDNRYTSAEEAEALSKMRSHLYSMYGKTYNYEVNTGNNSNAGGRQYINPNDNLGFDDPMVGKQTKKGYIPPTAVKGESPAPFGALLDPPIGG